MKITSIETIPIRVPIKPELAIRSGRGGSHVVSPFLLVKVHTDAGLVGIGEVSCTPRWSGEDQVSAAHFINAYFAPALIGEDPTDIDAATKKFASTVAGNPFTKAGVEMALWDLRGKVEGLPSTSSSAGRYASSCRRSGPSPASSPRGRRTSRGGRWGRASRR
jgi:L-alanine-DL-glutamate epimerase-like enolase superfamily enzyme